MNADQTLMMDPLQQEPTTGDLVQGYQLGKLLGKGAHGSVYLANKPGEAHTYALKIIDTQGHPRSFVERLVRECSISASLRHPGIITVHEAGYWGSCVFIVMDVAVGRACDQLQTKSLGWELALEITRQVARALDYAFTTAHVIHRDIKPANIVVDLQGGGLRSVKVVDFGLSRSIEEEGEGLTMTGMVLGTPFYMSPEQARGERDLTFHTDLYAVGASLFYLIAGRPPFKNGNAVEILLQHCNEPAPNLSSLVPTCPTAVSDLVARCLAKEPQQRFGTYLELIAHIDALLGEDPFEGAPGADSNSKYSSSTRYVHQALRDTSSQSSKLKSTTHGTDAREGSTSTGSDALGNLMMGKLQETTKAFRKRTDHDADAAVHTAPVTAQPTFKRPPTALPGVPTSNTPKPPAATKKPSLAIGTALDEVFHITDNLGAGAMGEVYAVEDRVIGQQVAMKILSDDDMRRPGAVRRFQAECSALATVEHPAFPFFAGKGTFQGRDYLLMERVRGIDLKSWLQKNGGRMGELGALNVVLQLAEGMDRAYAKCGMVHRDIKPANLMFALNNGEQRLKIVDFGVSTYIDYGDFEDFSKRDYQYIDDGSQGKSVGTPSYMSPEQCVGAPPSPLMDIYAIGCTFFHLITGRTPYQGPNAAMVMIKHIQEPPPTFAGLAEVSNGSQYLLKRCMAKNPRDRFANYQQIVAAVNSALYSLSTRIRRPSSALIAVPPTTATAEIPVELPPLPAPFTNVVQPQPGTRTWRRPGT